MAETIIAAQFPTTKIHRMRKPGRVRIDAHLVQLGEAESRTKAQALILAGHVYLGSTRVDKPGTWVPADSRPRVRQPPRYVSRGGYKLEGALERLGVDPRGCVCVDVGASTGGFTDCLLQRGALLVYAVDVGQGLLAQRLAVDPRVVVMDRTNARHLQQHSFPEVVDLVVVDASFIGMTHLAPALARILLPGKQLLAMIKPQFEVGRERARRDRGVISDPRVRKEAIDGALSELQRAQFTFEAGCDSPLAGPKGNVEYFVLARRQSSSEHQNPNVVQGVGPDGRSEPPQDVDQSEDQPADPAEDE